MYQRSQNILNTILSNLIMVMTSPADPPTAQCNTANQLFNSWEAVWQTALIAFLWSGQNPSTTKIKKKQAKPCFSPKFSTLCEWNWIIKRQHNKLVIYKSNQPDIASSARDVLHLKKHSQMTAIYGVRWFHSVSEASPMNRKSSTWHKWHLVKLHALSSTRHKDPTVISQNPGF